MYWCGSIDPLTCILFVICLDWTSFSHRDGFVGCLRDFFVVRGSQVYEDLPCLVRTNAGDGADGGKQQRLWGYRVIDECDDVRPRPIQSPIASRVNCLIVNFR